MKKVLSILLSFSIIIVGLMLFPESKAYACSCAGADAKGKLERSHVVFLGKVTDKGGTKKFDHGRLRKYSFEVDQAWKGTNEKHITIYSYDGPGASCGFEFEKNQVYLVYSYKGDNNLFQTNLCSGNLNLSQASDDLQQLGDGTIITESEDDNLNNGIRNQSVNPVVTGTILVMAIIFITIYKVKKRNN
ncbi:hypothetical protein [Cohnella panacarvi]|uniref:hypothetical protein n=1 Tax=Cohnella panacarvi TaxID=400776 RepID=UPI0004793C86|nr:hypothetical protein [Cohnella panacarvi]